jgi:PST family polysaccharide transporter/lipopolysaccharide exporter
LSTLKARTVRNVSYTGISYLLVLIANFVTMAVLARLLTPEEFGIVASALVVANIFFSIQDLGIMPAIVQRDARVDDSLRVGISIRWISAAALAIVMIAVSPLAARAFGQPDVALVLAVLSLNLFVFAFGFYSQTALTRSLRFYEISIATAVQYLAFSASALVLAFSGFSYWSLVIGYVAGAMCFVLVLRHFEKPKARPAVDKNLAKELLAFGKHIIVTNLMAYAIFNVDQLVIAGTLGAIALAFYYIAVRFGRMIGEQLSAVVNRVLFPTMARLRTDVQRLRIGYAQSLRMLAICVLPMSLGLSALSGIFVESVLGATWLESVFPLSVLAIAGLFNALATPSGNVLVSIGRPRYLSMQSTAQAVLLIAFVYPVAVTYGIDGVSVLIATLSFGVLVYFMLLLPRILSCGFRELYNPLGIPLASGIVMYGVLFVLANWLEASLLTLVVLTLVGLGVYAACLAALSRGRDVRDFLNLLSNMRTQNE